MTAASAVLILIPAIVGVVAVVRRPVPRPPLVGPPLASPSQRSGFERIGRYIRSCIPPACRPIPGSLCLALVSLSHRRLAWSTSGLGSLWPWACGPGPCCTVVVEGCDDQDRVGAALGDVIDLFAVALLSGNTVGDAVRQVSEWSDADIAEAFAWCSGQVAGGRSLSDALEQVPGTAGPSGPPADRRPGCDGTLWRPDHGQPGSARGSTLARTGVAAPRQERETASRGAAVPTGDVRLASVLAGHRRAGGHRHHFEFRHRCFPVTCSPLAAQLRSRNTYVLTVHETTATGSTARVGWKRPDRRSRWRVEPCVCEVLAGALLCAAHMRPLERGQTTAEYALVLLAAGSIAMLVVGWAQGNDAIGALFDTVLSRITSLTA